MKVNIEQETERLFENRLMLNNQEVKHFEDALANIFSMSDASNIKQLCLGFDDQTHQHEVMFGLIHSIEAYDSKHGVERCTREFIYSSQSMLQRASGWLEIMLIRQLNDDLAKM